jgi:hypothetical protein
MVINRWERRFCVMDPPTRRFGRPLATAEAQPAEQEEHNQDDDQEF